MGTCVPNLGPIRRPVRKCCLSNICTAVDKSSESRGGVVTRWTIIEMSGLTPVVAI